MSPSTNDIEQVIARYGRALDNHDFDALASLHHDDAKWTFAIESQIVAGPLYGRDDIIAFASTPPQGPPTPQRHVLTNVVINDISVATSKATAYLTLIAARDGAPRIIATGTASFILVATRGVWRIKTLLITFDNPPLSG
jgi:3-phenylpropionate/cinnamic acid dioxygenase small subunit